MVPLVADVHADVVEQRPVLEPLALAVGQPVGRARVVEELGRQPGDLPRMVRGVLAPLGQLDDAPAPHVGVALDLADLGGVAVDVVEHQAFAQGQVAHRELPGAEPLEDRVEQHASGHREVRAAGIEAWDREPRLERHRDDLLAEPAKRLGAHPQVAQVLGHAARVARGERAEAENRPRRADHTVEAAPRQGREAVARLPADVLHHPALVASRQRVALDEPLGQADHADLEAARQLRARRRADRDLDAAATDVHDDRRARADVHAVGGREMDEARLLGARDDPHPDAQVALHARDEIAAVGGLPHRAGRARHDLVHLVRFGQPPELRERLAGRLHGLVAQVAAVETARAKPDHVLLAVDDLKREVGPDVHDDHVDRVGPDVDGRDPHRRNSFVARCLRAGCDRSGRPLY